MCNKLYVVAITHVFAPPQVLLEQFAYRRAVDALRKHGMCVPDTYDLPLVEDIQAAQRRAGATPDYPGWQPVPQLCEPLPAFGLERPARPRVQVAFEGEKFPQ